MKILPPQKVVYKLRNNLKYYCRSKTDDFAIINELYISDAYLPKNNNLSNKKITILDIGAHIGIFAVQAAHKYPNAKIFSYEPTKANFEILKENITLNSYEKRIIPTNKAVWSKKGKLDLFLQDSSTGMHTFQGKGGNKVTVETTTLEEIFKQNEIKFCDILKIDIEGAEWNVFKASEKMFEKIGEILMEYHEEIYSKEDLVKFLTDRNFEVYYINEQGKIIKARNKALSNRLV